MRKVQTDRNGSFVACGVGLLYQYSVTTHTLEIFQRKGRDYMFRLGLDGVDADDIPILIENFDKALQIKALMISSHKTNDLTKTMSPDRLQVIIKSAFRIALHACDAQLGHWKRLNLSIEKEFKLKRFKLKRLICPSAGTAYIRCGIETPRENELTVRAKTTAAVFKILSEKIIHDLMTIEFAYRTDSYAHQLVTLSSKMGTLSRVLDQSYVPKNFVRKGPKKTHSLKA